MLFPVFILTTCSKLSHLTLHGSFIDRTQEFSYTEKLISTCRNELPHIFKYDTILHLLSPQEQPPLDESSTSTTQISYYMGSPIIRPCKKP